ERRTVHGAPAAVHADRGTSMTSKPVAELLLDLGVARSHSRPRVSNDNPYSESAFKTLKYAPAFPASFGSLADARAFAETFFGYYNHEHRHSGIGLHTPASVHYGTAAEIHAHRQATQTTGPTRSRLDQPARTRNADTDQLDTTCLKHLDTYRGPMPFRYEHRHGLGASPHSRPTRAPVTRGPGSRHAPQRGSPRTGTPDP